MTNLIFLSDIYNIKKRKQEELTIFRHQLEELQAKMLAVQFEIDATQYFIDIIEKEIIIDIRTKVKQERS